MTVRKMNENHDEKGQFASGPGGGADAADDDTDAEDVVAEASDEFGAAIDSAADIHGTLVENAKEMADAYNKAIDADPGFASTPWGEKMKVTFTAMTKAADAYAQAINGFYDTKKAYSGDDDMNSEDQKIIDNLKSSGLYDALKAQVSKDMTAGDVHVSTTGKDKPKKKPLAFTEPSDGDDKGVAKTGAVDFTMSVDVSKVDTDERLMFGWASVSEVSGGAVVDKQDDVIPVAEIEKGAYDFVLYNGTMGDMHERVGVGQMVESVVFTAEKAKAGLIAKNQDGDQLFGWWVGFKVFDDGLWAKIKSGQQIELSIGGRASSTEE